MKINKIIFLPIVLLACASETKYQSKIDSWVGHKSSELVEGIGEPARIKNLADGAHILYYDRQIYYGPPTKSAEGPDPAPVVAVDPHASPSPNPTPVITDKQKFYNKYMASQTSSTTQFSCLTFFEVNAKGVIVASGKSGNYCRTD